MATLSALVSGLEAELRRLGYKDSTLVWYRGCWRRMHKHFAARGIEEFPWTRRWRGSMMRAASSARSRPAP